MAVADSPPKRGRPGHAGHAGPVFNSADRGPPGTGTLRLNLATFARTADGDETETEAGTWSSSWSHWPGRAITGTRPRATIREPCSGI